MPLKMYRVHGLLLSRSTRQPKFIYMYIAHLQAERIGARSMQIARKTAKLFTWLGSSTQLGQSIVTHWAYVVTHWTSLVTHWTSLVTLWTF